MDWIRLSSEAANFISALDVSVAWLAVSSTPERKATGDSARNTVQARRRRPGAEEGLSASKFTPPDYQSVIKAG